MNKKAFTFAEIIIVVIFFGMLVSMAYPLAFGWGTKSRAAEAIQMFDHYHLRIKDCLKENGYMLDEMTVSKGGTEVLSSCINYVSTLNMFPDSRFSFGGASAGAGGGFGDEGYVRYRLSLIFEESPANTMNFFYKNNTFGGSVLSICEQRINLAGVRGKYYLGCGQFEGISRLPERQ